jgi:hypothetical protein
VSDPGVEEVIQKPKAKFEPAAIYFSLYDNCGRCHDWAKVEASVKLKAADSASRIRSGNMPKGNPGWKSTIDGKALLTYLDGIR